jgi:hypothetical protein
VNWAIGTDIISSIVWSDQVALIKQFDESYLKVNPVRELGVLVGFDDDLAGEATRISYRIRGLLPASTQFWNALSDPDRPPGGVGDDDPLRLTSGYLRRRPRRADLDRPSRKIKRALFLSAFAALSDPLSRAYYDRKCAEGDLALRWMERAWLAGDPLVALLYLFFALEGLLGDKSEGLKAHGLAFRQTMLSHVATGGFGHPNETWFLYDQVRSSAVHGEIAPEISSDIVRSFAENVRATLNDYLNVAGQHGLTKRGRLLAVLDHHADRSQLVAWLRTHGGPIWTTYLDRLEGAGPC